MNTKLSINSDLNKQAQILEVTISKTAKSYHVSTTKNFNKKLNFSIMF